MAEIRYNKSIVKNINESLIRKAIRGEGPFTKTKIARVTELSFPTVSRIIDDMAKSGEILRNGVDSTTGGRHAMSYVVNPNFAYLLCMYMSGASHARGKAVVRTLVINSLGKLIDRDETEIANRDQVVEVMDGIVEKQSENYPIRAISIGLPWGISNGLIQYGARGTKLMNFPLQQHMEEKFGIRTRVENDMNTIVSGCYARTFTEEGGSLVCVNIGTSGLGCGLYLRGHLIRGNHGFAGEISFLPVNDENSVLDNIHKGPLDVLSIAKIVCGLSCTVDPHTIVFYRHGNLEEILPEVREACKKFLPEEIIPELVVSDSFSEDYENGLVLLGKDLLVSGYEIVNR